eukprot:GILK01002789.1.p1 GENE.GILK01002789.1~~GILK01002789.1.p1  ORF type:complete len:154 (+),score=5.77 GILK01002789.1:766-1227(+)
MALRQILGVGPSRFLFRRSLSSFARTPLPVASRMVRGGHGDNHWHAPPLPPPPEVPAPFEPFPDQPEMIWWDASYPEPVAVDPTPHISTGTAILHLVGGFFGCVIGGLYLASYLTVDEHDVAPRIVSFTPTRPTEDFAEDALPPPHKYKSYIA